MNLSPRSIQIIFLLLQSDDYINLDKIVSEFKISTRTLFRELNLIKTEILKYNLTLDKKTKLGVRIFGDKKQKEILKEKLQKKELFNPKDKDERRKKLIGELLKIDEMMKLYYFADRLQTSESTISQDLEKIEDWFSNYNIEILKKKGTGIELKYEETDFRKALITFINRENEQDFIKERAEIEEIAERVIPEIEGLLTIESYESFIQYLSIMINRVKNGKTIEKNMDFEKNNDLETSNKLNKLLTELENNFNITLNSNEKNAVYIYYKSRKIRYLFQNAEEISNIKEEDVLDLIIKMIDKFDIKIAHELRNDSEFVKGLIIHLKPALIRMEHKIPVQNYLKEEIIELYPDIYLKTRSAVTVLEEKFNESISEDEIAYLAFHFGSAVIRLNYMKNKQRIVKVGIVCGSGIGVSSLLSSRLKNIFKEKIKIKTFANDADKYNDFKKVDFLVTTFELKKIEIPIIKVDAMIKDEQLEKISELIDYYMYEEGKAENKITIKSNNSFYRTLKITEEINSILDNFSVFTMDKALSLNDLMKEIGKISGETEEDSNEIYKALVEREKMYTQVLEEFRFTFLHSKVHKIKNSVFYIIKPNGECFSNEQLKNSKVIVIMLIREDISEERPAISVISESIFENENFYSEIIKANEEEIKKYIEEMLSDYLRKYISKSYN